MEWLLGHRYRRTTLVAVFCMALLTGLGVARATDFDIIILLVSSVILLATLRNQRTACLLAVILFGICVGGYRGSFYMDRLADYADLYNQKIVLVGKAVDDAGYGKQSQLTFDLRAGQVDGTGDPLVGKIGVSGFGVNSVARGDIVQVEGKLRKGLGSRQGYMSFAKLSVISSQPTAIDNFRHKFAAGMQSALPEPAASFAMGLLIGQRATLPASVYQDLVMVGLVHIIAVSGYNLTIILRACMSLLGNRSKFQTLAIAITLISVFLLITGASASIIRASIVSAMSIASWYYGRNFKPLVIILLAAVMTAYVNPLYPWGDIGWYLSFLAFYGVMILAPQVRLKWKSSRLRDSAIIGIALESLCAEIMTLPIVLYIFGQLSAVSLVANVLVAAFVPIAMLLSVIAGLAGMLMTPTVGWFAWPCVIILTYMLDTARILASIPYVFRENVYITAAGMVAMYAVIVGINIVLYSKLRRNPDTIQLIRDENTLLTPSFKSKQGRATPVV